MPDLVPQLQRLLSSKDYRTAKGNLERIDPADLVRDWSRFTRYERILLFKLLSVPRALAFFEGLEAGEKMLLLGALEPGALGPAREGLDPAQAEALFHRLPDEAVRRMMSGLRAKNV